MVSASDAAAPTWASMANSRRSILPVMALAVFSTSYMPATNSLRKAATVGASPPITGSTLARQPATAVRMTATPALTSRASGSTVAAASVSVASMAASRVARTSSIVLRATGSPSRATLLAPRSGASASEIRVEIPNRSTSWPASRAAV